MPLRSYKATSPGRRWMTRSTFEEITTDQPHKPLLEPMKRGSGRNNQGRLTVRHRGGGEKTHYRRIDFKRDKFGVPARLATIEYDPNRSARIGLLHYRDGEKRYMLLPNGLKVGDIVVSGPTPRRGWATPSRSATSRSAPRSTTSSSSRARVARSSARRARRPSSSPRKATSPQVRLPSGEVRRIADALHGDDRPGLERRSREPEPRQGRARPPHGPASGGPGRRDDPAGPSRTAAARARAPRACPRRRRGASPPWATGRGAGRPRAA